MIRLFLCFIFVTVFAKNEIYDGHSLFEVTVKDEIQAEMVNFLDNKLNVDEWVKVQPGRAGMVLVPRGNCQEFEKTLNISGVTYSVAVENIKKSIDLEDKFLKAAFMRSNQSIFPLSFNTVHRYNEVNDYLSKLAKRYSNLVTVSSTGKSFNGRDIKYVKISTSNFKNHNKPIVMIQSLLHAREWISLPVTLYVIQNLVINGKQPELLREFDWIIIPIANPDGYEWSHTQARLWRKSRATGYMGSNTCLGVDLNRNFDINWGSISGSSVCSEIFHGRGPFSEPETVAIKNIILEHKDRLKLFLDMHSFQSSIMYSYGNGSLPQNSNSIHNYGVVVADAIDKVKWARNPKYKVGNVVEILYKATGNVLDYIQSLGVTYSYTIELPAGPAKNGFIVDPNFIEQAGYETWEGIKAILSKLCRQLKK